MEGIQDVAIVNNLAKGNRVGHQKQTPPLIRDDNAAEPSLPSSLRGRYHFREESLPREHRTRAVDPTEDSVQPIRTPSQIPHIDNKASETFGSSTGQDLRINLGPSINGTRYGTVYEGDTRYDTRDDHGIH